MWMDLVYYTSVTVRDLFVDPVTFESSNSAIAKSPRPTGPDLRKRPPKRTVHLV
jgi:hypothetical protein